MMKRSLLDRADVLAPVACVLISADFFQAWARDDGGHVVCSTNLPSAVELGDAIEARAA